MDQADVAQTVKSFQRDRLGPAYIRCPSITVVIFCWRDCLISESMGHHDSEIMDDGGID